MTYKKQYVFFIVLKTLIYKLAFQLDEKLKML